MYINEETIPAYKHFNFIHSFIHSLPYIFLFPLSLCLADDSPLLLIIMYYVIIIFVAHCLSLIQLTARFVRFFQRHYSPHSRSRRLSKRFNIENLNSIVICNVLSRSSNANMGGTTLAKRNNIYMNFSFDIWFNANASRSASIDSVSFVTCKTRMTTARFDSFIYLFSSLSATLDSLNIHSTVWISCPPNSSNTF